MKNKFIFYLFFIISNILLSQIYYVSPSGDNMADGSIDAPFLHIQHAIDQGASEIYLKEGVYTNFEELNGSNVIIKANQGDNVVFDGSILVNKPIEFQAEWIQYDGNIYRTYLNEPIWQLFMNEKEMVMARWPNTTFEEDMIYNNDYWAHSNSEDEDGVVNDITDISILSEEFKNLSDFNNDDINGALLVANFCSFKTKVRTVLSSGLDVVNNKFEYTPIGGEYRDKHHYYFLENKLAFLDHPNEWIYVDGFLYMWSEVGDGTDLESSTIKGKNQDFAFILSNCNNITIEGVKFFASTISIQNSSNISILNNVFSFPNYSKRMLGDTLSPLVTNIDQNLTTRNLSSNSSSSNCIFMNNVFEYTDGEALILGGSNHIISNNYFHHIDWSCAETQSLGLTFYANGQDLVFENNSIHTTGASSTLNLGQRAKVLYNDISNTGLGQSDGSIVQITKNIVSGSETAYNWFHDTEKMGFRFDAPAGSADVAGTEGLAHHNVIWNLGKDGYGGIGMMIKGDYHEIYNNTVFNCDKTDILILDEDGLINLDTYTENNLADVISNHRVNDVESEDEIPGFKSNNYSLYGDHTNNNTSKVEPLLINSINVNYNASNSLNNRYLYNFCSTSSLILDQGKIINTIDNPIETHPNVIKKNITEGFQGNAPDIGAYEYGNDLWIPGINFEPEIYPWSWPSICTDIYACNYENNPIYNSDNTICEYSDQYYDCDGNCLNDNDSDNICDELDNCPNDYNPFQEDIDLDGQGDVCENINLDDSYKFINLIKIVDPLGRNINSHTRLSIYMYDNGYVEKKIVLF